MTAFPSVEPLSPGTRPTEPGLYVTCWKHSDKVGVGDVRMLGPDLAVYIAGAIGAYDLSQFTFIARIYPDRIGQE